MLTFIFPLFQFCSGCSASINDFEASQGTFFDLVGRILQKPQVPEIFATTAWFIWTHRNKIGLNAQTLPSCKISEVAKKFLLDFTSSRVIQQVQKTAIKHTWVPPKPSELKTNFDGSMFDESDEAGIRIVVRTPFVRLWQLWLKKFINHILLRFWN